MQRKLFYSMTFSVSVVLVIFFSVSVYVFQTQCRNRAFEELKTAAALAVGTGKSAQEIGEWLENCEDYPIRVTYVMADGTVAYDNTEPAEKMENHAEREEIKEALETGSGESERRSQTLDKTCCYYAVSYRDGVLRLGAQRSSFFSIASSAFVIMVVAAVILIAVTAVVSMKISKSVMRPIHDLVKKFGADEDDGGDETAASKNNNYEELEKVAETADKLLDETHRTLRRLNKEKEKFSLITEKMAEGMILLDSDMTVLSVNRTAIQLFNPEYDPSAKLKLENFTKEPQLLTLIEKASENGSERGVIRLKDRSWRTFVNKSEYAEKYGFVIILADVTESIKSEEIRRDFSASVSHELKTPLTTIKGFGEMMENGIISDGTDVKRYGGTIYREASRLLSLINDIIRLSEIEDESIDKHMERTDLMQIIADCDEILQYKAEEHEVTSIIKGDSTIVFGNRSYLTELVLNLMDNSIKYNKAGGQVLTEVKALENGAQITVEDTGIGISEADRERVFERFYRVDKSRSKQTGGTGLGLSIVKHIVSLHGGRMSIESRLDEGTKITVFLPYRKNSVK